MNLTIRHCRTQEGIIKQTPITLNNGDLIIIESICGIEKSFLVSSYRDGHDHYCLLINLQTGSREFCKLGSRITTIEYIAEQLKNTLPYDNWKNFQQYKDTQYSIEICVGDGLRLTAI